MTDRSYPPPREVCGGNAAPGLMVVDGALVADDSDGAFAVAPAQIEPVRDGMEGPALHRSPVDDPKLIEDLTADGGPMSREDPE